MHVVASALLLLALSHGASAQSYGYSYSYSYSYGGTGESACNVTNDARGGANCEDRWAVLYPAELMDYGGHSCHYKSTWGQCATWYVLNMTCLEHYPPALSKSLCGRALF